ncbi:hypothetical protein Tco_0727685 [Tanacetum coccineum]|uniref:Uncharacterized protein n=1 Tax=Tanacetum coccineum TaxID=301880 RepID=A0ABQ4YJ00_9ASTR
MDKCKIGLGYNAVPPPYTGNFMPPKHDFVYPSLDDFMEVNESIVEKPTIETNESKTARKEKLCPPLLRKGNDLILQIMKKLMEDLLSWRHIKSNSLRVKVSRDGTMGIDFKNRVYESVCDEGVLRSRNPTEGKDSEVSSTEEPRINQEKDDNINSTNNINTASDGNITNNVNDVSSTVNAASSEVNVVDPKTSIELPNDPNMPELKDIVYSDDEEDVRLT